MIQFFKTKENSILAVECSQAFNAKDIEKLTWLFSGAQALEETSLEGIFIGPRREMITPWSTNA
ncbi:MAG: hypothetical protein II277_05160, partial [Bacteroidales bacterium]|nr:hypothetical protein [Bacteroidales bacterium]